MAKKARSSRPKPQKPVEGVLYVPLREHIRQELERRGMSQAELARRAGIAQPSVNMYLRGRTDFIGERIDKLLRALHDA